MTLKVNCLIWHLSTAWFHGYAIKGFPDGPLVKNPLANAGDMRDADLTPG